MGWGRMLLLGNVGQQLDIQDTQRALEEFDAQLRATDATDRDLAQRLDRLAAENAELKLYLAAVVRLLLNKGIVTSAELEQIVDAIDRSDGAGDGKLTGKFPPA
jgi:bifunctional N-acetylglucosamine-1-phosphate-uridyltransferase/glucosamine-1-phosphate-acetyltransferase GlmU-like protein